MRNARLRNETEVSTGGDSGGVGSRAVLEAPHIRGGYRGYARIGLVVFSLADGDPFFGFRDAVDDEFGEAVWTG
jgi:hypothetical protein